LSIAISALLLLLFWRLRKTKIVSKKG
jgi:hypothetical protein